MSEDHSEPQRPRLLLIDGHSMAFRAFYALPADNFSTSGGQHTNAVYGFISMLSSLLESEHPTHIAVAFDVSRKTFRSEIFPDYKAQRAATPEEFKGQVELIKEVLHALSITTLENATYEADDIIATLAAQAEPLEFDSYLVTGDRDYFQLITDSTTVLYPKRGVGDLIRYTPEALVKKYALTPEQYPDFAALRGDPSDNLPSVPKVGEKTATKWIQTYDNLDNLVAHAEEIRGKVGESFREHIDQVLMNRKLTQMVRTVELPVTPTDLEVKPANVTELAARFDDLEFGTTLRHRILAVVPHESTDSLAEVSHSSQHSEPAKVIVDSEDPSIWLDQRKHKPLSISQAEVVALVDADRHGLIVNLEDLSPEEDRAVAQWIADADSPKYVHGGKALYHFFAERGYTLQGITQDTELAAYLLRPGQRTYELSDVVQRYLSRTLDEAADGQLSLLDAADSAKVAQRAAAIWDLAEKLTAELQAVNAFELYHSLEIPLISILARMERAGIAMDVETLEEQKAEFEQLVAEEEHQARELVQEPELNLGSPKQLQDVLFGKLHLPKTKKTKTGYSTAAKEIEALAVNHPHNFLTHLLRFREFQKMKTTLEGLIKAVDADGRIHTTFNQTATSTGRLSSLDPNLQNIPVRTEAGRAIRRAFIVGKGYDTLLTADYSQIEMRVMAHVSEDPGLIEAYKNGEDLHNYVGSKVFDVPIEGVTPDLRRKVKAMSYGLAYGLSAYGLAQQLGIQPGEAKSIMDSYFLRFGGVKKYLEQVVVQARKDGYTSTLFGRRRYLPELMSTNRAVRTNAERAALNAPIQGTAADIIKVAMVKVDRQLTNAKLKSRVLLQVHDELVVEVAPGEKESVTQIVEREMDSAIHLLVPLEVSTGMGQDWNAAAH